MGSGVPHSLPNHGFFQTLLVADFFAELEEVIARDPFFVLFRGFKNPWANLGPRLEKTHGQPWR